MIGFVFGLILGVCAAEAIVIGSGLRDNVAAILIGIVCGSLGVMLGTWWTERRS